MYYCEGCFYRTRDENIDVCPECGDLLFNEADCYPEPENNQDFEY